MSEAKTDQQIREEKTAAAVKELASKPASPANDKMIAALLRERAGLEVAGKTDRVAQVDEQLEHYGYEGDQADPRKQPPVGRSATPPNATAPASADDDLDALRAEAETAGVKVDGRWKADKLKAEIAAAGKGGQSDE